MTAPYSITGTVNSAEMVWTFNALDDVMKRWEQLGMHRVVPESKEPVAALTLFFGEQMISKLKEPYAGLAVP
jgi:hypothetical protein